MNYNNNVLIKIGKDVIGDSNVCPYLSMHDLNILFVDYFAFKNINILNEFEPQINISRWVAANYWMIEINKNEFIEDFMCWYLNNYLTNVAKNQDEYIKLTGEIIPDWNWTLKQNNLTIFLKDNKYSIAKTADASIIKEDKIINIQKDGIIFLMSFHSSQKLKYDVFKKEIEKNDIKCFRINEIIIEKTINEEILNQIKQAKLCIFDITDANPNVMFELGYSIGINVNRMIIKNEGNTNNPFNISNYQIHSIKEDQEAIESFVTNILIPYYIGLK